MLSENMLKLVYDIVTEDPGIDTPMVCLEIHEKEITLPEGRGPMLAKWLSEYHDEAWTKTCDHVDSLIETGHIVFTDSGSLYPAGYQGEIDQTVFHATAILLSI